MREGNKSGGGGDFGPVIKKKKFRVGQRSRGWTHCCSNVDFHQLVDRVAQGPREYAKKLHILGINTHAASLESNGLITPM